jgi:hypothetical protein
MPDDLLDFLDRKAGHMAVFGILALLVWRAVAGSTLWRHPSPVDVGIDATGALIAVVAVGANLSRRA